MTTVERWDGHDAALLRQAMRMSVRTFATHLGVAVRTVSKWEAAGVRIVPRPELQAALDSALDLAGPSVCSRFETLKWGRQSHPVMYDDGDWEDDLERCAVAIGQQDFASAAALIDRRLSEPLLVPQTPKACYLYARTLVFRGDMRRDQGHLHGSDGAGTFYSRAQTLFHSIGEDRRLAQAGLAHTVVLEMSGNSALAAARYSTFSQDRRLGCRDRTRALLWLGTALDKTGMHRRAGEIISRAGRDFDSLGEQTDWLVSQQKLALALRGAGEHDRALRHIDLAAATTALGSPLQQLRLMIARAHILLGDRHTQAEALTLLHQAETQATRFGLGHQLASARAIRSGFEHETRGRA